jgi:hypothetical protein
MYEKEKACTGGPSAYPRTRRICYNKHQLCPRRNADSSPVLRGAAPYSCIGGYAMTPARDPPRRRYPGFAARGETTWHTSDCRAVAPQLRNPADRVATPTTTDSGFDDPLTDDIKKQRHGKKLVPPLGTNRYKQVPYRGYQSFPVSARAHARLPAMSP